MRKTIILIKFTNYICSIINFIIDTHKIHYNKGRLSIPMTFTPFFNKALDR